MSSSKSTVKQEPTRAVFSTRTAFLMAAIGSAVGLGNIWRFPYVAYESGGGAFLIPYLVALLTAGIPLLFLDYAMGHRFRGSPPKAFRRFSRKAETVGWIQVGVAFFITLYYSLILGWALLYAFKSFGKTWGDDANGYFFESFLQMDADATVSSTVIWPIAGALLLVWILTIGILYAGVDKGIGGVAKLFVPLLIVLFMVVVVFSLTLDGAVDGLNAFFTPDWTALANPGVWIAAYGQIFFSLSVAFGLMVTYASYLRPRTNLTASGLTVGFSNSAFEVLAGVGVFATLGFMAMQAGSAIDEVATSGIGLAFVAFPTVISQMGGLFGSIFGFLFFASLFLAGLTSLMSLLETVVSSVQDKLDLNRKTAVLGVGIPMAVLAMILFPTTSGLATLDVMDKFTNSLGIVGVALIAVIIIAWVNRRTDELSKHLDAVSSFSTRGWWKLFINVITPVVLLAILVPEVINLVTEPYEGYSQVQIGIFGWGVVALIIIAAVIFSTRPWKGNQYLAGPPGSNFGVPVGKGKVTPHAPQQAVPLPENVVASDAPFLESVPSADNPTKES
ncbi:sodium-dependent transporter [Corynebacterium sputi]|uniref:sodium-dependent transporter n=1 Tax=Corynebacterium sputi TaxID=489915 RepID=UPI0004044ADC|nr:sodium-dependent transporter [Corynebacterium sputi]